MDFARRVLQIFCFMLLFLLFIPQLVFANNGQVYEVHSNLLNIRAEPSPDSDVIGMLHKGDTVTVFNEEYGWVQTYYGGEEVWVAKHHLVATDNAVDVSSSASVTQEASSNTITVTADGVWIRQGPSTAHDVITSANAGNQYTVIHTEGDWHQITLENGTKGWIASWMTDHPTTTTAENAKEAMANAENVQANAGSGSLTGYTIVLDPGHGGRDPGAIGLGGVYEKNLVTQTASTIASYLRQAGAQVIETRSGDYFVSLEERARISNNYQADAFISIHYDAYPILTMQGITSYYYSNSGYELAEQLQHSLAASTSLYNRGVMFGDYRVLRDTAAPAALLELGFITNSHDLNIVQTEDYQNTVARAITNGLISYFQ